jgi:hypothetical protein
MSGTDLLLNASFRTEAPMRNFRIAWIAILLALCVASGFAQDKKKKNEEPNRSVRGMVITPEDAAVSGAVVYLKNTKTLQIRSFITQENGTYSFRGLSPDTDYELRAEHQGTSSGTKTLSSFDSRKEATINLKLNAKK